MAKQKKYEKTYPSIIYENRALELFGNGLLLLKLYFDRATANMYELLKQKVGQKIHVICMYMGS